MQRGKKRAIVSIVAHRVTSTFLTPCFNTWRINLINFERTQKAVHLLVNTDMPLTSVAESVGINDYTYFIKIFKRYTSHSPKYFRNKNAVNNPITIDEKDADPEE